MADSILERPAAIHPPREPEGFNRHLESPENEVNPTGAGIARKCVSVKPKGR
jgi:hypothetical protein